MNDVNSDGVSSGVGCHGNAIMASELGSALVRLGLETSQIHLFPEQTPRQVE
jgi:hypothetical protein